MNRFNASLLVIFLAALAFAGGPIGRNGADPIRHSTAQPLSFNLDLGDLAAPWPNSAVAPLVADEFARWDAVPGSQLRIQPGPQLGVDITTQGQILTALNSGQNPVVLDETGQVFEDFGFAGSGALAFAGPTAPAGSPTWTNFFAVIGGQQSAQASEQQLRLILLHEFGHGLGLGHSNANGYLVSGIPTQYENFGFAGTANVEVMYFTAISRATGPLVDDVSGYLALYGDQPHGTAGFGAISGRVFMPDGVTPADGINVIVRDRTGGAATVFANAASVITCCGGAGEFFIPALPPGEYSVEITDARSKNSEANASYSDPIRTDLGTQPTSGGVLGAFPGDPEFYNGPDESNNGDSDDPSAFVTVTVTANNVTSGIDIIFNREAGLRGSTLAELYFLPEINTTGGNDTYVGIVNPSNDQAATVQVFGFSADGNEFLPTNGPANLDPRARVWLSVADLFPGNADQVAWIQVGSDRALYVFGELRTPTTRSAYWASEGLLQEAIMPHVARNTAVFETFIASVNGQDQPAVTDLTAQPNLAAASLSAHATGYAQDNQNLQDLFGEDLTPIDWVQINSDLEATASMEFFTTPVDNPTKMASLDLNNQRGTTLRFLHIATNTGLFWTGLVYINVSDVTVTATETFYDATGAVLSTVDTPLAPGEKITLLFDSNNQVRVPAGSSWMEVSVPSDSGGQLVGYELFGSASPEAQDVFSGLRGNYTSGLAVDYPHLAPDANFFTAIVATNLGNSIADVAFQAIRNDGTILGETTVTAVAPNQKVTRLLTDLFSAEILADTGWIRALPTDSDWAGFQLWGDQSGVRQFLSGIVAPVRGERTNTTRTVIQESQEDHFSYDTAQVLTQVNGVWDVNVVATIAQSQQGEVINQCCLPADDIEDIFSFTLTEATDLLIAVSPADINADLDLFVVRGEFPNQDFFSFDPGFEADIDFSASAGGVEDIARRFEPGTYYILVSLFEGDTFADTEYGLLVTEQPLLLTTFDDPVQLEAYSVGTTALDTDGSASWAFDSNFADAGAKFGSAMNQQPPTPGAVENSLIFSSPITIPNQGLTVYNYDFGAIVPPGPIDQANISFPVWVNDTAIESASQLAVGFLANAPTVNAPYGGGSVSFISWGDWVGTSNNPTPNQAEWSPGQNLLGQVRQFGVQCNNVSLNWMIDNLRIYNIVTSLNKAKQVNDVMIKPGRSLQNKPQKGKPYHKQVPKNPGLLLKK